MTGRRRGRPKLDEPRTEQCNVRLTVRERAILDHRVALSGIEEADFARAALLAGSPSVAVRPLQPIRTKPEQERDEEIRRIGVNLNQLVRHINTHPDKPLPAELPEVLDAIRGHLRAVLQHGA